MAERPPSAPEAVRTCWANDLIAATWARTVWYVCGAAFLIGFFTDRWRPILWIVGLGVAGALCLLNAARCGRLHCYITGPVDLAGAILTGLRKVGVVSVSWTNLGTGIAVGILIGHLIERVAGNYVTRTEPKSR